MLPRSRSTVLDAPARRLLAVLTALCAVLAPQTAAARDASPLRWDERPGYSYLERSTDQVGVAGYDIGAGILPDGAVFTPSVEVVPWLGGARPGVLRTRGLPDPQVPLIATGRDAKGRSAAWWGARLGGVPSAVMALGGGRPRDVGVALRWGGTKTPGARPGNYRYRRPATPERAGVYSQRGERWRPRRCWRTERRGSDLLVVRGRSVVAIIRGSGPPSKTSLPGIRTQRCDARPSQFAVSLRLRPERAGSVLHVVVPLHPVPRSSTRLRRLLKAPVRRSGTELRSAWRATRERGAAVRIPEPAVQRAYDAAVTAMLLPRFRRRNGDWVQTVNLLQYHAFWLRDAAVTATALGRAGLTRQAREDLDFFHAWQGPSGEFNSRIGQRDGHGQALWALGQYVRLTGDDAAAGRWREPVRRALDWLEQTIDSSPTGLLPASDPRDNELVAGTLTGDQLWAVAGLDGAAAVAAAAGDDDLERRAERLRDVLRARVEAAIRSATLPGQPIPPSLDAQGGTSWGELWASYPYPVLQPRDPLVLRTLAAAQAGSKEGIATYNGGKWLHSYMGFRSWQTLLRAGDQRTPLDGLYATLAHLTATGGAFETGLRPYGSRRARVNLAPHGWFAAELTTFIHDLLAREQDDALVLLGAVPSRWLAPGEVTEGRRLTTLWGELAVRMEAVEGGARLTWWLKRRGQDGPRSIAWPLPPGIVPTAVTGDGELVDRTAVLRGDAGTVDVRWVPGPDAGPDLGSTIGELQRAFASAGRTPPR